jgi:hypothetical protein
VLVHVARQHDRVVHPALGDAAEDPLARGDVAVPAVHAERLARPGLEVALGEEDLLGQDVPARPGGPEALEQPGLLLGARDRARRVQPLRAVAASVSPHAWSERYWRVSRTLNSARSP